MRMLDAIERRVELSLPVTQRLVAADIGISERFVYDLIEEFPSLGKLICNCKRRTTVVEDVSIIPEQAPIQESAKSPA
jgi:hypothetical protein